MDGGDAFEHILCGASAVQVGTVLVEEGLDAFRRLEIELGEVLTRKGYRSIQDCRGRLKEL
jgi:dihydroorotate dehydrogenase (fumarate)